MEIQNIESSTKSRFIVFKNRISITYKKICENILSSIDLKKKIDSKRKETMKVLGNSSKIILEMHPKDTKPYEEEIEFAKGLIKEIAVLENSLVENLKNISNHLANLLFAYSGSLDILRKTKLNRVYYYDLFNSVENIKDKTIRNDLEEIFKDNEIFSKILDDAFNSEMSYISELREKQIPNFVNSIYHERSRLSSIYDEKDILRISELSQRYIDDKYEQKDITANPLYREFLVNLKWSMDDFSFQDKILEGYKDVIVPKIVFMKTGELKEFSKYLAKLVRQEKFRAEIPKIAKFTVAIGFAFCIFAGAAQKASADSLHGIGVPPGTPDGINPHDHFHSMAASHDFGNGSSVALENGNIDANIGISKNIILQVSHASDPNLDLFSNATGFSLKMENDPVSLDAIRGLSFNTKLGLGLINLPNFLVSNDNTPIGSKLLLTSAELGIDYTKLFSTAFGNVSLNINSDSLVKLRSNVSLYDKQFFSGLVSNDTQKKAESIFKLGNIPTLSDFSQSFNVSGGIAGLKLGYFLKLSGLIETTVDQSVQLDYSAKLRNTNINTFLQYDMANYKTFNDLSRKVFSGGVELERLGSSIGISGDLRLDGTYSIGISGKISLDHISPSGKINYDKLAISSVTPPKSFGDIAIQQKSTNQYISYLETEENEIEQHNIQINNDNQNKINSLINLNTASLKDIQHIFSAIKNSDPSFSAGFSQDYDGTIDFLERVNKLSDIQKNYIVQQLKGSSDFADKFVNLFPQVDEIKKLMEPLINDSLPIVHLDENMLKMKGLSFDQIAYAIKEYNPGSKYNYKRVTNSNGQKYESPDEFLKFGGVCRDSANLVATLFNKTSSNCIAKNVGIEMIDSGGHMFTVVKDTKSGNYYTVDYGDIKQVNGAKTFSEAAASYGGFTRMYVMAPDGENNYKMENVIFSNDYMYLSKHF